YGNSNVFRRYIQEDHRSRRHYSLNMGPYVLRRTRYGIEILVKNRTLAKRKYLCIDGTPNLQCWCLACIRKAYRDCCGFVGTKDRIVGMYGDPRTLVSMQSFDTSIESSLGLSGTRLHSVSTLFKSSFHRGCDATHVGNDDINLLSGLLTAPLHLFQ